MTFEISVVIPAYNAGRYIEECINSVLAQKCSDLEVIVVDDCSTDNTRKIVSQFDANIVKYICLDKNFGGPSKPRNVGVKAAIGQYIVMLDADDVLTGNSIQQRIEILKADQEIACVFSDGKRFDETNGDHSGTFLSQHSYFIALFEKYNQSIWVKFTSKDAFRTLAKGDFILPSGLIVRKSVYDKIGLYDESVTNSQDLDMSLRIAKTYPIAYLDITSFKQRVHASSISAQGYKLLENKIILLNKNLIRSDDIVANSAFKCKISENYISLAYYYRMAKNYKLAREYYSKSLRYTRSLKAIKGWFISSFAVYFNR
ncbi:MAG: glycosyltransferase involved in cell wall biosynthesis [Colwellia sp.]|jgi:glycosyltransferase involved in cell wall biosynthesis